ncbi:hypothetical protein SAMN04489812_5825 [Microlunatus soli]|uniref:Glyoxalase-like domain-containing protein n=1 Tax=Microlunatus soli TaxID=630515 RepID=A0A1H2ACC4_9ACTN|nr:hypothetical protein SAMN04489812_5825 [Microlunatus soli]
MAGGSPDGEPYAHIPCRFACQAPALEEAPKPGTPADAGYALVCPPEGVAGLALNFEYDANYRRPTWPTAPGEQIVSQHLDIGTTDLDGSVAWAIECGATPADHQPSDHFRVLFDPDGHPFCLCRSD